MSDSKFEFTDRYQALGIPYPDPETVCRGQCEGIGFFPTKDQSLWPADVRPAGAPEDDGSPDDGWRFIRCPDCNGTGKCDDALRES